MPINTTTTQLAKLLGVMDYPNVKDFTLKCSAADVPQLLITQYVRNVNAPPQLHERLFDLIERTTTPASEPSPIDIDNMALNAQFRLDGFIERLAYRHSREFTQLNRLRWAARNDKPIISISMATRKFGESVETLCKSLEKLSKVTA